MHYFWLLPIKIMPARCTQFKLILTLLFITCPVSSVKMLPLHGYDICPLTQTNNNNAVQIVSYCEINAQICKFFIYSINLRLILIVACHNFWRSVFKFNVLWQFCLTNNICEFLHVWSAFVARIKSCAFLTIFFVWKNNLFIKLITGLLNVITKL
jgi:hypothetical protein